MGCIPKSSAEKQYVKRIIITMVAYVLLVLATTHVVRRGYVTGWVLYVCAVLPSLAIFRMLHVVALYLKEETDEFIRQQVVNSLLSSTAAILGLTAFADFLRSYTALGTLPPFTVFVTFWVVFGVAQGVQSASNRAVGDD